VTGSRNKMGKGLLMARAQRPSRTSRQLRELAGAEEVTSPGTSLS